MAKKKPLTAAPKKMQAEFRRLNAEYHEQIAARFLDPALASARYLAAIDVLASSRVAGTARGIDMTALLNEVQIEREPITIDVTPKLANADAFKAAHGAALGDAMELHREAADAYMETVMSLAKGALVLAAGI